MNDIKEGLFIIGLCAILWPLRRLLVRSRTGVDPSTAPVAFGFLQLQAEQLFVFVAGIGLVTLLGGILAVTIRQPSFDVHWAFREVAYLVAGGSIVLSFESIRRSVKMPRAALAVLVAVVMAIVVLAWLTSADAALENGGLWGTVASLVGVLVSSGTALLCELARRNHRGA
ncbi:MAG: hypothetical protein ACYCX5_12650 [Coriobacteriia bacterium]